MGQNQSAEKTASHSGTPQTDRDRRVNRRTSVPVFSHPKAPTSSHSQPADVSASNIAAQGRTTNVDPKDLERMLHASSPEFTSKSSPVERSSSRRQKREQDSRPASASTGQPVSIPGPAPTSSIDIPTRTRSGDDHIDINGKSSEERSYAPVSHHRPPRLPLPIQDGPESPSLHPVYRNDEEVPSIEDGRSVLARRNSMLSVATQEEEDIAEELQPFGTGQTTATVPYTIEWNLPAERVFVTGTFAAWDKKYRLRRRYDRPLFFVGCLG